jgi:hypothetical protein
MQTLAQNTHANKFPTYETLAEAQAHADYAADRRRHTPPAPVEHYAIMDGAEAHAVQTAGGWRVQLEGQTSWVLVSTGNPNLVLLGRCDLAEAQRAADEFAGGFAAIVCGRR